MSVSEPISELRHRVLGADAAKALASVRQRLEEWGTRLFRSAEMAAPAGSPGNGLAGCPEAFAGLNRRLVSNTWQQSHLGAVVSKDGRLRLAGEQTLDLCVTPAECPRAIAHFARWLDYLAADGIGLEIRMLDGWRTCAVVDGIAVPIRIRERLMRLEGGYGLSAQLERVMGGRIPSMLVPSGRLELQLLRMGVSFASFPVEGMLTPALLEAASKAIREMAGRQVEYQRRMHAVAVAEVSRREGFGSRAAARHRAPVPYAGTMATAPGQTLPLELLTGIAALSAMGAGRMERLLESMEATLRSFAEEQAQAPQREDTLQMAASMLSLAQAMTAATDARHAANQAGLAVVHDGGVDGAQPMRRSRRPRYVA